MKELLPIWRPRSIRVRLALVFGVLIGLAMLNIGAFYWGARQRDHVFGELERAIALHGALIEAKAVLDDQATQVKVVSDLLGVEHAGLTLQERAATAASIGQVQHALARTATDDPEIVEVRRQTDSLAASWRRFYEMLEDDPEGAIAQLVLEAEPLAHRLLGQRFPAAITAQNRRVEQARAAFVRTDRTASRLIWTILLTSGAVSSLLAWSLSRDILGAISALKAGADRFGAGELAHRVSVTNCDELEEVGLSLNTMAERLRSTRDELELRNDELAQLAFFDPLTRLANRRLFRQRVEQSLAERGERPDELAVLFLDLDNFKSVNDTQGHAAGDLLLMEAAARLLRCVRTGDLVARLGGDEFGILLDPVRAPEEAVAVAERMIVALHAPFQVTEKVVRVGVSIGVAVGREGQEADELLRDADVAMYRAKGSGKGRYAVFVPAMHTALLERLEMEAELRDASHRDEMTLVYQPIVDLVDGRVVGFEALARWHHPQRGTVSPALFIPLAEEAGTILPLGRWVLAKACREAVRWSALAPGDKPIPVSVNVSGHQLEHPSFVADVMGALNDSSLSPESLILEITESAIMRDSAATLARLRELRAFGVRLAIDDFGTGYSSLAYLQRFPFDILKIDKAFVDTLSSGESSAALARAILAIAGTLGLDAVAEGIEEPEHLERLRELGCPRGQGFLFSRPLSPADVTTYLREARSGSGVRLAADR